MSRAQELMPVSRDVPFVVAGLEPFTDEMRAQLDVTERHAPVPGGPDVRMVVYRPKGEDGRLPVVLHSHGGGFCLMHPEDFAAGDAKIALMHRAVVVSVDYRLAPEYRYPAGFDDCYAALEWTVASADELRIDLDHLVVYGASAGGALTAALCLKARDHGGPRIAAQVLSIPVIDDRLETPSMEQFVKGLGFSGRAAEGMWLHYLGENRDIAATPAYAAPGRAESLAGLPPAVVLTHGLDPLRDEGIGYALRLLADGVSVELHNIPGAFHGAPPLDEGAMKRGQRWFMAAIGQALGRE